MHSTKRSRIPFPAYPDVKVALLKWLQHSKAAHLPVNGTILRETSSHCTLATKASSAGTAGSLDFEEQNSLTYLVVCGESGSTDSNVVDDWHERTLAPLLQEFVEDDA
ncbi:hypothetical protein HPB51_005187 [Rhipicephalus microplus]|uniref:Tick transposon n=1 Tax=Rhipicephalus microplus TaxID=6941 RepID=A0A9J6DF99_RHIMP|nr:hypothetical protein HPB51_005187 [Rhipicephalus microplus]